MSPGWCLGQASRLAAVRRDAGLPRADIALGIADGLLLLPALAAGGVDRSVGHIRAGGLETAVWTRCTALLKKARAAKRKLFILVFETVPTGGGNTRRGQRRRNSADSHNLLAIASHAAERPHAVHPLGECAFASMGLQVQRVGGLRLVV